MFLVFQLLCNKIVLFGGSNGHNSVTLAPKETAAFSSDENCIFIKNYKELNLMFRIYYDFEYENNFDHPITLYYFIFDEHIYTNPTTIKKSMLFSNPTSLKINNPRGYQVYVRTDFNHNIPDIITKSKEFYLPNILFVYFKYLEADQTYFTMEKVETFPSTIHIPATGSYLIKIGQESKEITFPDHSSVYIRRNDVSTSYQVVNNDISSLNFPAGTSDNDCVELVIMAETNEYRNLYIDAVENPNNYNIVCYRKIGESVFNSIIIFYSDSPMIISFYNGCENQQTQMYFPEKRAFILRTLYEDQPIFITANSVSETTIEQKIINHNFRSYIRKRNENLDFPYDICNQKNSYFLVCNVSTKKALICDRAPFIIANPSLFNVEETVYFSSKTGTNKLVVLDVNVDDCILNEYGTFSSRCHFSTVPVRIRCPFSDYSIKQYTIDGMTYADLHGKCTVEKLNKDQEIYPIELTTNYEDSNNKRFDDLLYLFYGYNLLDFQGTKELIGYKLIFIPDMNGLEIINTSGTKESDNIFYIPGSYDYNDDRTIVLTVNQSEKQVRKIFTINSNDGFCYNVPTGKYRHSGEYGLSIFNDPGSSIERSSYDIHIINNALPKDHEYKCYRGRNITRYPISFESELQNNVSLINTENLQVYIKKNKEYIINAPLIHIYSYDQQNTFISIYSEKKQFHTAVHSIK